MSDTNEKLLQYLAGTLIGEQKSRLEAELASSESMREKLGHLRLLRAGMNIEIETSSNHLTIEQVTRYAESGGDLLQSECEQIEEHLADCEFCREEFALVAESLEAVRKARFAERASLAKRVIDFLWGGQISLKPAYGILALIAIAVPLYLSMHGAGDGPSTESFHIYESQVRGVEDGNVLQINTEVESVELEFSLPVRADRHYDLQLASSAGVPIMTLHSVPASDTFRIEIPRSILQTGDYKVIALEFDDQSVVVDTFDLPVQILFSE